MNKKGIDTRTILWAFYIILVLIITYFMYTFIDDVASGRGFTKKYFVNDLGLTFDTLSSANYQLEMKYYNLDNYDLSISKGKINLVGGSQEYYYVPDNNLDVNYRELSIKNGSKLEISKSDNLINFEVKNNEIK